MESLSVSEFKRRFSEILKRVQQGESFIIVYGRARKPVAKFVPVNQAKREKPKSENDRQSRTPTV